MTLNRNLLLIAAGVTLSTSIAVAQSSERMASVTGQTISTVERAMQDELVRSKEQLKLQGLIDPFFIAYTVGDQQRLDIQASNGSLTRSDISHNRQETVRLLVNNYQLNDENFADNTGFFSFVSAPDNTLPLDDDYLGIRRALWLSTDDLFKSANENFTKKQAAMQHKQLADDIKDLPDFAKAPALKVAADPVELKYDRAAFESLAQELSGILAKYSEIQSSNVSMTISNSYQWIANTEGTQVRKPVTLCEIKVVVAGQATPDGEPATLSFEIDEPRPEKLPTREALRARVEELGKNLVALSHAPLFDKEYTGPVLFEGQAASQFLSDHIISRLAAKREDVLGNDVSAIFASGKSATLKEKLNTRILPTSVSIVDASLTPSKNGVDLLGYYPYDDEGVAPPASLTLVDKGILKTLYMTRTPTKEIREPNGHARSFAGSMPGFGENVPAPGVVEITDGKAKPATDLRKELLSRAKDDGYDYALVVRSIQTSLPLGEDAGFSLQDMLANGKMIIPSLVYKVYRDGREELVRGAQIGLPTVRDLRELITSRERDTRNMTISGGSGGLFSISSKVPASLIGPRMVLCPELEVQRKKAEAYPTQPVVERPQ